MYINSLKIIEKPHLQDNLQSGSCEKRKFVGAAQECIRKSNNASYNKEDFKSGNITDESEVTALNFGSKSNLLKSDGFANLLAKIDSHNQTYNALVALILAGLVRPALTMVVPGVKDKKDKIYSSAQAVSSGVLGFGVTMLLTRPLDDALGKALKTAKNQVKDAKDADALKKLIKNIPEWVICVPRAMLTIALIPFILKYVFGLEKSNKNAKPSQTQDTKRNNDNYENLKSGKNFKDFEQTQAKSAEGQPSFSGRASIKGGLYDKFTDKIAQHISTPMLESKFLQKMAHKWRESDFLFNHIATVTSLAISGTYAIRTLKNNNLEEDKRKVLALNQGLTFLISTTLSYLIDGKLGNWWQRVTAKFIEARTGENNFAADYTKVQKETKEKIKLLKKNHADKQTLKSVKIPKAFEYAENKKIIMPPNMKNMVNGLDVLKKMVIIGSIFRLAVPVLVTPIAANLGDKYLAYKREKAASSQSSK